MGVHFSLVYPTRHRPAFIRQALWFLEKQEYRDFEVIISDNYLDPALSCENECRNSPLANLKYVHPPQPVGMVENWNYALQFASGDYICYFTDKMFLLPYTLAMASKCIDQSHPEIVNWVDNFYNPKKFPDYFGEGEYVEALSSVRSGAEFSLYDPHKELSKKGRALVPRSEQDKSTYIRGKICFGAFRADLCNRIAIRTGALFHNVAPDYTSMILGLSMARSAAELNRPGIVHVNTDLSNGRNVTIRDELAFAFLKDLGNMEEILDDCLVPGLYCSTHNMVAHDYLTLRKKYDLDFQFDAMNWLAYITEDIDIPGRQWSTKEVEIQQREILNRFVHNLSKSDFKRYQEIYHLRCRKREKLAEQVRKEYMRVQKTRRRREKRDLYARYVKKLMRSILPEIIINGVRARFPEGDVTFSKQQVRLAQPNLYHSTIEDILE